MRLVNFLLVTLIRFIAVRERSLTNQNSFKLGRGRELCCCRVAMQRRCDFGNFSLLRARDIFR